MLDSRLPEDQEGRSVKTLPGGEKFLVSLALSIGLSHMARCGGIRIEAMFIDEGFGSLDDNSIQDAISVLETMQDAHTLIGIISHIQLLKERIPAKLEVTKTEDGSRIVPIVG